MAENTSAVGRAHAAPAAIRAEMAAARARISAEIETVEAHLWPPVRCRADAHGHRDQSSLFGTILTVLGIAERLGLVRYLRRRLIARRSVAKI